MPNIFEPSGIKYEYPHLIKFAHAIHESFWTPSHFTYDRDVLDFKTQLSDSERKAVKRSILAIGVVENKVKTFWARVDQRLPKTEIADVGHTFAGNEVIHKITYQKLLTLLGLESDFDTVLEIPCMSGRSKYLTKYLDGVNSRSNKEFTKSLILFTLLIENTSLFTQFLIMGSFFKYKAVMANFNAVVSASTQEERVHGKFGSELINIIRNENPEWFDDEMEEKIRRSIRKAFKAECEVLDWILEAGELSFLSKESIIEYLKYRFNESLSQIGYKSEYDINQELLEPTSFFERSLKTTSSFDFFNQKGTSYNLNNNNFDSEDLW